MTGWAGDVDEMLQSLASCEYIITILRVKGPGKVKQQATFDGEIDNPIFRNEPTAAVEEDVQQYVDFQPKKGQTTQTPGSAWFSSLWTLQEASLLPDALLADANWNILLSAAGVPFTLDNVTTMTYSDAIETFDCNGPLALLDLLTMAVKGWELPGLVSQTRLGLVIAASSRISRGPRAEAIMSVLGVHEWFEFYRIDMARRIPRIALFLAHIL